MKRVTHVSHVIKGIRETEHKETKKLKKHFTRPFKFKFKYPKILLFVLIIIASYFIFTNPSAKTLLMEIDNLGYWGMFIAGIFFSLGFTAPVATGYFLVASPENILLSTIVAGLGSLVGDLIIFGSVKVSFKKEFDEIKKTALIEKIEDFFKRTHHIRIGTYILYALAGLTIASPLPDEIGITMLAGFTSIKIRILSAISFILHSIFILIIFSF